MSILPLSCDVDAWLFDLKYHRDGRCMPVTFARPEETADMSLARGNERPIRFDPSDCASASSSGPFGDEIKSLESFVEGADDCPLIAARRLANDDFFTGNEKLCKPSERSLLRFGV